MPNASKQILLIEDHERLRLVLQENLENSGYIVLPVATGQQGLDLIKSGYRPNVVISDLVLPRETGHEILSEIRAFDPGIKLVAMTGTMPISKKSQMEHAQDLGADAILQKPFDMIELENTICSLVLF